MAIVAEDDEPEGLVGVAARWFKKKPGGTRNEHTMKDTPPSRYVCLAGDETPIYTHVRLCASSDILSASTLVSALTPAGGVEW